MLALGLGLGVGLGLGDGIGRNGAEPSIQSGIAWQRTGTRLLSVITA